MYLGCLDSDGDGVADFADKFPREPSQWDDSDGDGYGDNPDGINADDCVNVSGTSNELGLLGCLDTDNDGYGDILDAFPNEKTQWSDTDNDGYGDNENGVDTDDCVLTYGTSYLDKLGCVDSDGDGYSDIFDDCIQVFGTSSEGVSGCPDSDGDGYADLADECPDDPNKWEYGTLCIEEDEDSGIINNQNNTIENQEDTLIGQCICPDESDGIIVSPDSDDDGTVDGCMCQNNNKNSELASEVQFDEIIMGVIALFSVILLLLFFRQYKDTSNRKKLRKDI